MMADLIGSKDMWKWAAIIVTLSTPLLWMVSSAFRCYVKITALGVCVILNGIVVSIASVPWPCDAANYRTSKWFFLRVTSFLKLKWEIRGEEKLKSIAGPCIIMANHQSVMDCIGMMEIWPDRCVPMVKMFVDRFKREKAIETLNQTVKYLKEKNTKLWIFPEGTRGKGKELLPFKKGPFHLAVQGQLQIVPIVFSSYEPFYDITKKKFDNNGFAIIEVLDPIAVDGMDAENVNELTDTTRGVMVDAFKKISVEAAERYAAKNY